MACIVNDCFNDNNINDVDTINFFRTYSPGLLQVEETIRAKDLENNEKIIEVGGLAAGEYELFFKCLSGKLRVELQVEGIEKNVIVAEKRILGKGKMIERDFGVKIEEDPGRFKMKLKNMRHPFQTFKGRYYLSCVKSLKPKKVFEFMCRILVDGKKIERIVITNTCRYETLCKELEDRFGGNEKIIEYLDPFNERATIDDEESMEIFVEENVGIDISLLLQRDVVSVPILVFGEPRINNSVDFQCLKESPVDYYKDKDEFERMKDFSSILSLYFGKEKFLVFGDNFKLEISRMLLCL